MSGNDLRLIGVAVGGTWHHDEGDLLVFGSHDFPAYRITIVRSKAERYLEECAAAITDVAQAD